MLWTLLAIVVAGLGAAGIALLLRKLTRNKLPKWIVPLFGGLGMLGYQIFYEYSSRGELVPDDVTVRMWQENIRAQTILGLYKPHDDLLVLDGIPRNARQAELMDNHIKVLAITALSNVGKMFPAFCYRREAALRERLALSVGMFPRGEVGAGVLVISLSYGLGGPALTVAVLSLALR